MLDIRSKNQNKVNERLKIQTSEYSETLFIQLTEEKSEENFVFTSNVSWMEHNHPCSDDRQTIVKLK